MQNSVCSIRSTIHGICKSAIKSQNGFKNFLFNNNSKTAALFPDTAVRVYQYPTFCFLLSFNFFLLYRPNITEGNGRCTNTMFSSPFSLSQLLSFLFSFISRRLILMQQRRTEVLLITNPFLSPPFTYLYPSGDFSLTFLISCYDSLFL